MQTIPHKTTTLYFKQGSSDKEYTANLVPTEWHGLWNVTFAYGKRGGPQKTGIKTSVKPLPYQAAKEVYLKLLHAKQLKGYTVGEDAAAFADNPNAGKQTEFMPQLANDVTKGELKRICLQNMGDIFMQTKHDGERRGVIIPESDIQATNRKGQAVPLKEEILAEIESIQAELQGTIILDTEDMGDHLEVFDVTGPLLAELTVRQRQTQLQALHFILVGMGSKHLRVDLGFWPTSLAEVWEFIDEAERNNEEGVIIRIGSAPYEAGRPNSLGMLLKLKFTGEATCRVIGHTGGKRSVTIAVLKNTNLIGDTIEIGKVTIPPNYEIPDIGDLVEIKYMNIMKGKGAKLFQPRFKGVRTDKSYPDIYNSLKFKKGA